MAGTQGGDRWPGLARTGPGAAAEPCPTRSDNRRVSDEPKNRRAERRDQQGRRDQQERREPAEPQGRQAQPATAGATPVGPRPEPIRFFGTTWLNHDGNYQARRAGVSAGSLAAVIVSGLVLRLTYEGLQLAAVGGFVSLVVVPLQTAAWVARGLVFEFMELAALAAYQTQYRRLAVSGSTDPGPASRPQPSSALRSPASD